MAYGNQFQANYGQPMYPVYPYQVQPNPPQPQSNMIWVQGEGGAKSYLMQPNTTLPLWDSESQTIYLKTTDITGKPTIKVLDYTIRGNEPTPENIDVYVKKQDFDEFAENVKKQLSKLSPKQRKFDVEED